VTCFSPLSLVEEGAGAGVGGGRGVRERVGDREEFAYSAGLVERESVWRDEDRDATVRVAREMGGGLCIVVVRIIID
jgi:hypothetical protein